jgi:DNA-binding transcriptional ArsR family regulator
MDIQAVAKDRRDPGPDINLMAEQARAAANLMKAVAHEGRLMILCHLVGGEKSVSELEELIGARQAAVSQQLARLRLEGLVRSRRDGKAIYYSIGDEKALRLIQTLHDLFCILAPGRSGRCREARGTAPVVCAHAATFAIDS